MKFYSDATIVTVLKDMKGGRSLMEVSKLHNIHATSIHSWCKKVGIKVPRKQYHNWNDIRTQVGV